MLRRASAPWVAMLLVAFASPTWAVCGRICATRPEGCGKGFGTLAYVVSTCRVVGTSQVASQELRVQRAGCDPVTVMRFDNPEPMSDPFGLCTIVGRNHLGTASPIAGVFQRLGVSETGKSVVFEVNDAFELVFGQTPLAADAKGFFYVRADGTGLRRLGPPSRDPTYRIYVSGGAASAEVTTRIPFRGDRLMAFTDIAPGPDGVETEQLFSVDLVTGDRRQVTHVMAGELPRPGRRIFEEFVFVGRRRIYFVRRLGEKLRAGRINIDGTESIDLDPDEPPAGNGSEVVPTIRQSRLPFYILVVGFSGLPVNNKEVPDFGPPTDLFAKFHGDGHSVQLTNYRYGDTTPVAARPNGVLFQASADPVGENPFHNCQLFRISPLGLGLRQLTHFDQGRRSEEGCQIGPLPGCGLRQVNEYAFDASPVVAFYSDCDPLGTNSNGSQVFAMRWDGSHLQQVTHTRGVMLAADGSVVEVELPGPVARGGSR